MGSCVSCICCCEDNIKKCSLFSHRKVGRTRYFDSTSLVEFENLIEETEYRQPSSISSWLSFRRKRFHHEEALELEEEAALEARREAARVAQMVQSPEIIDPAKLPFTLDTNSQTSTWVAPHNQECTEYSFLRHQYRANDQHVNHTHYFPLNQVGGAFLRDRINTVNSTPPSSIDLEWENEEGLTPPAPLTSTTDEDVCSMAITSTPSNVSRRSTPLSNGNDLEWDGDFTSAQIVELDTETEQLISEIEQMTSQALKDTGVNR